MPDDDAGALAARVAVQEHIIYPLAAKWHLEGRLVLTEEGATLDGRPLPVTGMPYREDLE
jgi:phosphoribosylglycinamide formyltransferase-1